MVERGEIFDPTPEYKQGLEILFDGIFRSAEELLQRDDLHYSYRHWRVGSVVYSAVQTMRLDVEGVGRSVVFLARCQPDVGGLFQFRTYCYQEGSLQVINDIVTAEQMSAYVGDPEAREAHASQVSEEYGSGIHTAPDEEYVDFMVDLYTFTHGSEIE